MRKSAPYNLHIHTLTAAAAIATLLVMTENEIKEYIRAEVSRQLAGRAPASTPKEWPSVSQEDVASFVETLSVGISYRGQELCDSFACWLAKRGNATATTTAIGRAFQTCSKLTKRRTAVGIEYMVLN